MLSSCANIAHQLTAESSRLSNKRPSRHHQTSRLDLLAASSSDNLEASSGSGSQSCSSITDHGYLQQQQQQQQQRGPQQVIGPVDNHQANGNNHFINSDGSIYSLVQSGSSNSNGNYLRPTQHSEESSLKQANSIAEQQQQQHLHKRQAGKPVRESSLRNNQEQHRRLQYQVHQQLQKIYGNRLQEFEQHNQIQLQRTSTTLSNKRKQSNRAGRPTGGEETMRPHHQCPNHHGFQDRTYDSLDLSQQHQNPSANNDTDFYELNYNNSDGKQPQQQHHHHHQRRSGAPMVGAIVEEYYEGGVHPEDGEEEQEEEEEEEDDDDQDGDDAVESGVDAGHNMVRGGGGGGGGELGHSRRPGLSSTRRRLASADGPVADDRNRQLESLHYATATAAALLNVTATAAAAFAAASHQNTRGQQAGVAANQVAAARRPPLAPGQPTRLANKPTSDVNANRRRIYSEMYQDIPVGPARASRPRCQSEPYHNDTYNQAAAASRRRPPPAAVSRQRAPIYSTASERPTMDMMMIATNQQRSHQPPPFTTSQMGQNPAGPSLGPQMRSPPRGQQIVQPPPPPPPVAPKARPPPPSPMLLQQQQQLEWLKLRQHQQHQMQLLHQRQQQLHQLYQQQQQQAVPTQPGSHLQTTAATATIALPTDGLAPPTLALLHQRATKGGPMMKVDLVGSHLPSQQLKNVALFAATSKHHLMNQQLASQHQQHYSLQTNEAYNAYSRHQARLPNQMAIYGLVEAGRHMKHQLLAAAPPRPFIPVKAIACSGGGGGGGGAPSDTSNHSSDAPLVVDRSRLVMKPGFIEKICNIDLKLFWWSLLIVSGLFVAAFFTITRHVLHQ